MIASIFIRSGRLCLAILLSLVLVGGCGEKDEDISVNIDPAFVDALVDWHLSKARQQLGTNTSDSLLTESIARHGMDSLALSKRLQDLSATPAQIVALYVQVGEVLREEQRRE